MDSNQVMTQNGFLEFDSSRLTTQKLQNILIKINSESWLKKALQNFDSNRLTTQNPIWNIDSNQVMTQWFESTVDFVDLFLVFTQFRWPFRALTKFRSLFWAFTTFCWPFLGDSTQAPRFESAYDSSGISKTWIDSTHDSSGFPRIDSESTHDSSGFPRYWFRLTHDSKCFPIFSIQINSWIKQKTFDSDSTYDSSLSHRYPGRSRTDRPDQNTLPLRFQWNVVYRVIWGSESHCASFSSIGVTVFELSPRAFS